MADVSHSPGWARPVSYLPDVLLTPRNALAAVIVGWLTAIIPSIMLGAAVSRLFPATAQPQLDLATGIALFAVVVAAPVLETVIMASVLAVLRRFLSPTAAVILSSLGWGIAHSLAAPAWGLVIWWPFLIFSVLFVTWREHSLLAALAMPATVHAMQNAGPALLLFAGAQAG